MQTKEGEKSILEVTRANYLVPKGEERVYHYKVEKQQFDPTTGKRLSRPKIQKTGVKMFSLIKRNLELQGYVVEILYAPDGKYVVNTTQEGEEPFKKNLVDKVRDEASIEIAKRDREIEELKNIIAKQGADMAELKSLIKASATAPVETKEETEDEAKTTAKKAGRPSKAKE